MQFTYLKQPSKKFTFEQPKLKKWIEENCRGKTLNLFAGKVVLDIEEIRVDINPSMVADYYIDAYEFVKSAIERKILFDTIILDPPYNLRKAREKYEGKYIGSLTKIKNLLPQILKKNGIVISLGYDTVGMAKIRGFKKVGICLVCHGGDHNDTICLKEIKN
jgi:hypothetical protein